MIKLVSIVIGWVSFVSGILIKEPSIKVLLLSVARVLPPALLVRAR